MISVRKLCKNLTYISLLALLGYLHLFSFLHIADYFSRIRTLVAFVGIILAAIVFLMTKESTEIKKLFRAANQYMAVYVFVIGCSAIYTMYMYKYTLSQLLIAITPYLYISFVYPILYIFFKNGEKERFLRNIGRICIVLLLFKAISWILYTNFNIEVFHDLLFQYKSWSRNGILRVEAGYLFGFIFAYYVAKMFTSKKTVYKMATIFLFAFMIVITRYRFQLISMILTFAFIYYYSANKRVKKNNRLFIFFIIICLFVLFGGLESVLNSFSVHSQYGASTSDRILTIVHYWQKMIDQKAILGLGILDVNNTNAYDIMYRLYYNRDTLFFLEDIGILGGFFRFGILSIPLYGSLFYQGIKVCRRCVQKKVNDSSFLVGVVSYMIVSCLALNIFDVQRAFNIPFYIAVISYYNYIYRNTVDMKTK